MPAVVFCRKPRAIQAQGRLAALVCRSCREILQLSAILWGCVMRLRNRTFSTAIRHQRFRFITCGVTSGGRNRSNEESCDPDRDPRYFPKPAHATLISRIGGEASRQSRRYTARQQIDGGGWSKESLSVGILTTRSKRGINV